MADRDIELIADLYADPRPVDAAARVLVAQLDEPDRAEAAGGDVRHAG